jgi:ribokinase
MSREIVVVGSLNLDMVATVPRNPQAGETISGTDFQRFTGGKGANQAAAAARLGHQVFMIGRHGTDGFEVKLLDDMRALGVDATGITPADGPSGIALILVSEAGQNSIVVIPGSNGRLCAKDIRAHRERIEQAGILLTQLETPLDSLEETLTIAAAAGVPVMLDPAPMRPLPKSYFEKLTWFTPNETEVAYLLGKPVPADLDLRSYAERVLDFGCENVLLKMGGKGAYLATRSGVREHIPSIPVTAVDSTAAGDALNGAMAVALMRGSDPVEAARFGVAAASLSVTHKGAIPSLPSFDEVEAFRARSGTMVQAKTSHLKR